MICELRHLLTCAALAALAATPPASAQPPAFGTDTASLRDPSAPGPPRQLFLPPLVTSIAAGPHWTKLTPGAVVYWERAELATQQLVGERELVLAHGAALPAGTVFLARVSSGARFACLPRTQRREEHETEPPPLCLADGDRDGLYDHSIRGDRRSAIAPLRLRPLGQDDPERLPGMTIDFRVRVAALDAKRVEIDWGTTLRGGIGQEQWHFDGPVDSPPEDPFHVSLRLQPGETARLAGLELTVEAGAGEALWLRVEGSPSWIGLSGEASVIVLRGSTVVALGPPV